VESAGPPIEARTFHVYAPDGRPGVLANARGREHRDVT
jgi:hypothetical protein